jgi:hypothetical protein
MTVISVMLFGIEEIGTQLEEPFTVLPMQAFCDKIYNWCTEIVSWSPGDNGRPMKAIKPEHAFFTDQGSAPVQAPPAEPYNLAPPAYVPPPGPVVASPAQPNGSMEEWLRRQGQGN